MREQYKIVCSVLGNSDQTPERYNVAMNMAMNLHFTATT